MDGWLSDEPYCTFLHIAITEGNHTVLRRYLFFIFVLHAQTKLWSNWQYPASYWWTPDLCLGRPTDSPQISLKTSSHESYRSDRDSNPCGEELRSYKSVTLIARPRVSLYNSLDNRIHSFEDIHLTIILPAHSQTKQ